ncbi:MAG TPA: cytochrome ubiquinol oxidase subunit I [bacterium]|nr:cytochrome ubiquinol oxidase subunit I [bacterium]
MDVLTLSREQFGFTVAFHYIFPPLSIGLGLILVLMEGLYYFTQKALYLEMAKFWTRIFGLIFAIGVASGIVMEFQFGTNWAAYSRFVGDVFGSALAAEGIFAFFLESGFLALLLFGWDRISRGVHFFATFMVALGAHFSAVWIVVANSWQQTPSGYHLVGQANGTVRAEVTDFWQVIFSPSTLDRLWHVYMGAWQAGAFAVLSVSAYYLLRNKNKAFAESSLKIALTVAVIASSLQLLSGHDSAVGVSKTQPAKLAAYEGHYDALGPAPLYLLGWVDEKNQQTHGLAVPGLLSWLVTGKTDGPVTGLNAYAPENRPPVNFVFQTYHAMIAIGMLLILIAWAGVFLLWRGTIFKSAWYLKILVPSVLLPQFANQLGWFSAEVGRQPYIVYNLMKTSDALSKTVQASEVLTSLILFGCIYLLLFVLFIYLLNDKIQKGLQMETPEQGRRA